MNKVVNGFTDERMRDDRQCIAQIAPCCLCCSRPKQKAVSIDKSTAGRGESVRRMKIIEASHCLAGRVDGCCAWHYENVS